MTHEPTAGKFFCIYTGEEWPESERSAEHIIPHAIGGPDTFVTKDASKSANNRLGTEVDAPMIDDLRVTFDRIRLGLIAQSGKTASLVLNGTTTFQGRTRQIRYTIRPNSPPKLELLPDVQWHKDKIEVHCSPEEGPDILQKVQVRATKKGISTGAPEINQSAGWHEFKLKVSDSVELYAFHRAMAKIAIGTAHFALGYRWTRSTHADQLRACLNEPDPTNWKIAHNIPIAGVPDEFNDIFGVGRDKHVLILYHQERMPLMFTCILFGSYFGNFRLADTWDDQALASEHGLVYVVDCRDRTLQRYTTLEFIDRKSSGQL